MRKFFKFSVAACLAVLGSATQATSMGDFWENKVVDHLFRGTAYTAPATLYVGLSTSTTACSDSALGSEVSGGSYARVAVTSGTAAWNGTHGNTTGASSGSNGTISNAAAITFPTPSASWGTIRYFFISDAATAGNVLVCQQLVADKTVNGTDPAPSFAAGALTFQIDN